MGINERKPLGKILEEMKAASAKQIKDALKLQHENPGKKLGEILIEQKVCSQVQVTEALAKQFNLIFMRLEDLEVEAELTQLVPKQVCDDYKICPVKKNGRGITVAMSDPLDFFTLDNLRFILNTEVECVLATREDVVEAVGRIYGGGAAMKGQFDAALEELTASEVAVRNTEELETKEEDDAPVIRLVTLIIAEAVRNRASDIHVEPMEKKLRIRYRIDGVCQEVDSPPKRLQGSVLSRLKIMADMDIAEKRKPQDGRIKIKVGDSALDIRVSILPGTHGECMCMRILDKKTGLIGLEELGFSGPDYKRFQDIIKKPNGIFLVTGPTGSGKTTTLYAALKELNKPDVKIITAENPVEYVLAGVNQSQVKTHIGFTFGRIIRAMLRQAPNIILVGEIRDQETAEIAIQAALTGHLVFSTLHTNDAPGALTRLLDMGVKPFLVASSVQAIMGQRLVRRLCPNCKEPHSATVEELGAIGLKPADVEGKTIYHPVGCDQCKLGYKGRQAIFELMEMSPIIRDMTFRREPTNKMREQARIGGMTTLLEDGVRKILDGISSIAEILNLARREDITY
ncbi:MAG: type II secretory pathway ATPase PulE/Tfp pilus assembly pathway ATPase [Planctomycetota bacterium]|nr:MAG: type II secretory pathway ATPase PulE/Tfp pilus assembly pathway ATPase [Planctomycetota bacterium]